MNADPIKEEEVHRKRSAQKALDEIQKREKELQILHEQERQMKEEDALKRKSDMEKELKGKILSSNR